MQIFTVPFTKNAVLRISRGGNVAVPYKLTQEEAGAPVFAGSPASF